jgi:hypothetical protein
LFFIANPNPHHHMKQTLTALSIVAALSGCAQLAPAVPDDYKGPVAFISDSVVQEDGRKGQVFYVASINGISIPSALTATRQASQNQGFALSLHSEMRRVPVEPLKLKLVASHVTAAPIHELASRAAGTFFFVEGEVSFTPVEGGDYVVKGELKKDGSSVWLADAKTLEPVTAGVSQKK